MILRPPRSTRTATRFPDTTLVRSALWRGERRRKRPWPVFPYLSRPASATYGHDPPYSRRSARRMRRRGGIPFSRSVRRAGAENRTSLSSRTFAEAVSAYNMGSSGTIEQDDTDTWPHMTRNARGAMGKRQTLKYGALLGENKPDDWPGGGSVYAGFTKDDNQWQWWLAYRDLMLARD